jgi:two-component system response regulator GlrR
MSHPSLPPRLGSEEELLDALSQNPSSGDDHGCKLHPTRPRGGSELVRHLKEKLGLKQLIGESKLFVQEIEKIPKIARCDLSVLLTGETGTGKELFARAIHHLSPRSGNPFVPVNCGALPAELVENELFGHETGAFTGATSPARGLIHESGGGSIFLDEIDSLPLQSQVKLLRLLQEKEYRPLGSSKTHKADVRVIAASNADFKEATDRGRFRQDLFYRVSVITLSLPPLRQRKEDIPLLAGHFLASYSSQLARPAKSLSLEATQKLLAYDWPGNIRELENIMGRAVILSEHPVIGAEEILLPALAAADHEISFKALKARAIRDFEQAYLQRLLLTHDGNITRAAQAAQKNRRAFWQLIQKHQIEARCFRPHLD